MSISKSRWCVVHTQPRGEKRAEHNLRIQGYAIFAPLIWRKIRHARQFKSVEIPLFPRYIFVKLDLSRDRWRSINGTAGVSKLVTVLDRPLPLPEGLVETLMTAHACRSQWALGDEFQVNKPVQMSYGPFAELIGRIQRVDDRGRVHVLLEIMGRAVSVQTTVSQMRLLTACVAEPRSAPHLARTICPDR
jgi:transcriptional antiterminator RfaH